MEEMGFKLRISGFGSDQQLFTNLKMIGKF